LDIPIIRILSFNTNIKFPQQLTTNQLFPNIFYNRYSYYWSLLDSQ